MTEISQTSNFGDFWNCPKYFTLLELFEQMLSGVVHKLALYGQNMVEIWVRGRSNNCNCPDDRVLEGSTLWKLAARVTFDLANRLEYRAKSTSFGSEGTRYI